MVHEIISQALTQNFTSCCFHNDWSNNSAVCLGLDIISTAKTCAVIDQIFNIIEKTMSGRASQKHTQALAPL